MSETSFTLRSSTVLRGALLAFALVCGAAAQEHGRLLALQARGDAQAAAVEILGDRPLSFTTLKLSGPPRVVVDFADTDVAADPRELAVDDGTVRRVAVAAAGQRTARVVIELAAEAEFDVRAHGNRVEVRVPRAPPVASAAAPPAPGPDGAPAPGPTSATSAPAPSGEAGAAPGEAAAQPAAAEPPAAASEETTAGGAGAGAQPREQPSPAPEARAARGAEDEAAARKARAAAAVEKAAERAAAARLAREQAPGRQAHAAHPAITFIGFRPIGSGEVLVHGDHPLEYAVSDEGAAVVLHFAGASIPLPNNRRPLDTRFFAGVVQRIVPLQGAGSTDVRIELNGRAAYRLQQAGSVLTVTFSAP